MTGRTRPPYGRWWKERRSVDSRSQGSMAQFVRDMMAKSNRGYSRQEVLDFLLEVPAFAERIRKGNSCFPGMFSRLVDRQEIRAEGHLFYSTAAAVVEGEDEAGKLTQA